MGARRATPLALLALLAAPGAARPQSRDLLREGVDLAPGLRRLADSIAGTPQRARREGGTMETPTATGRVELPPTLLSHPPIPYPPEMEALSIAATVVVEATINAAGVVEPASVRVVESSNAAFDAEAVRVVRGSRYRPGRARGQAVRVVIRQPIRFAGY